MRTTKMTVGCVVLAALWGCMGGSDGAEENVSNTLLSAQGTDDNGTELSATSEASDPVCLDGDTATVNVSGLLTTTGSVDSAEISVSVDGGEGTAMGTIEPQDFEHHGRVKDAPYSLDFTLENGTHTIDVCFTQSGAQGREPKQVCAPTVTVVVDCTPDESEADCSKEGVFGDLVHNKLLCSGGGTPHVPVHLRGEFGEVVTITIEGPNDFTLVDVMNHAGESCNYHYNWDTRDGNHGNPGSYTFTFDGDNGAHYEFTRDLLCKE